MIPQKGSVWGKKDLHFLVSVCLSRSQSERKGGEGNFVVKHANSFFPIQSCGHQTRKKVPALWLFWLRNCTGDGSGSGGEGRGESGKGTRVLLIRLNLWLAATFRQKKPRVYSQQLFFWGFLSIKIRLSLKLRPAGFRQPFYHLKNWEERRKRSKFLLLLLLLLLFLLLLLLLLLLMPL